jgi:hypothetical protein
LRFVAAVIAAPTFFGPISTPIFLPRVLADAVPEWSFVRPAAFHTTQLAPDAARLLGVRACLKRRLDD